MKSFHTQRSSVVSGLNQRTSYPNAPYYEQRNIVKAIGPAEIFAPEPDTPCSEVPAPSLFGKVASVTRERSVETSLISNRSALKSRSGLDFERLYLQEQTITKNLRSELACLKDVYDKLQAEKVRMSADFEDYIKRLEEEIRLLKSSLQKFQTADGENLQKLEALVRANSDLSSRKVSVNTSMEDELRTRVRQLTEEKNELQSKCNSYRVEITDLVNRVTTLESQAEAGRESSRKLVIIENENRSLRTEITTLRSRPASVQERVVHVESPDARHRIEEMTRTISSLNAEITFLRNKPPTVTERVVNHYPLCDDCGRKSALIDYLTKKVNSLESQLTVTTTTREITPSRIERVVVTEPDPKLKTENVLTISCNCNQKCENCGATPQTNVTIIDDANKNVIAETTRVFSRDPSPISVRSFREPSRLESVINATPAPILVSEKTTSTIFQNADTGINASHFRSKSPVSYRVVNPAETYRMNRPLSVEHNIVSKPLSERTSFMTTTTRHVPPVDVRNKENLFFCDDNRTMTTTVREAEPSKADPLWTKRVTFGPAQPAPVTVEETTIVSQVQKSNKFNEYSF